MNVNQILQLIIWAAALGLVVLFAGRIAGNVARKVPV